VYRHDAQSAPSLSSSSTVFIGVTVTGQTKEQSCQDNGSRKIENEQENQKDEEKYSNTSIRAICISGRRTVVGGRMWYYL